MLFNSYVFILLFLPITWGIYFLLNYMRHYKLAQICLVIASLVFYGFYNWQYLLVIIGSIVVNYSLAILGQCLKNHRFRILRNNMCVGGGY